MTSIVPILVMLGLGVPPSSLQDTSGDQRAILRLEEAWRLAQRNNDTAAFTRLLAPDLTFIGTSGSLRDRAGYVASRSGSWIPRAESFTVTELQVRVFGATAIVTGRWTTTGTGVEGSVRFTDVWLRRQGEWQLIVVQRTDVAT